VAETNWLDMHKFATTTLEGEFPVVIVEATVAKTNDQSKDMIKCKVKIESGPFVDRPVNVNFTISPDSPVAMRILFGHWAVLGLDQKFFAANPNASLGMIAQSLIGRRATAKIGNRPWNGRDIEDIQEWKPALGGPGGSGVSAGPLGSPGLSVTTTLEKASPVTSPASPASPVTAAQPQTDAPALPF
jgi:hypothetical protein